MPLPILLLGSHGLLGSAFHRALRDDPDYQLLELSRAELNLTNPALFERTLETLDFRVLINCAAYTAVDDCEIQGELAYLVNGQAPGTLARICARRGARLIQFSTDFVFDGQESAPYTENDEPHPLSVYGKSKLLGEQLVQEASPNHLVIRLSWLFGVGRSAFPEWIIKRALNQHQVEVVADKWACPTFNRDVAQALRPWFDGTISTGGLLHFCNPPACSWIEYGEFILNCAAEAGLPLLTTKPDPIFIQSLSGMTARRPAFSALCTARYETLTGKSPRSWKEAMKEYIHERYAAEG